MSRMVTIDVVKATPSRSAPTSDTASARLDSEPPLSERTTAASLAICRPSALPCTAKAEAWKRWRGSAACATRKIGAPLRSAVEDEGGPIVGRLICLGRVKQLELGRAQCGRRIRSVCQLAVHRVHQLRRSRVAYVPLRGDDAVCAGAQEGPRQPDQPFAGVALSPGAVATGERDQFGAESGPRDIAGTRLGAELVTLSSCNSAGRKSYAGEGLVGLDRKSVV